MFRFANPQYLWLLVVLPVMVALFWLAARSRRKRIARFGHPDVLQELMPEVSTGRVTLRFLLLLGAMLCLILAAARPQFGSKLREEKTQGIEMMLVVDVSNSMLAEDFEPNRLDRTKYAIDRLVDGLKQDRIGVIAFAGEAHVQLPITSDYRMARAFTRKLSPSLIRAQGTDIAAAINLGAMSFSSQSEGSRVMILITDGENHESDAVEAARAAAERGIKIYTVGIGTPEGAPIMLGGEYMTDENGDMVVSKLDEEGLKKIALEADGAYVRATKQNIGLQDIVDHIRKIEQRELSSVMFEEYDEQFRYLLALALVFLLVEWVILDRKNPLLARFDIFRK